MLYRLPAKRLWEQSIPAEESPRNVMFKTLAATQQAETAAISEVGFHGFGPSDRRAGGSTQLLQARNGTWALTNPFAHFIFPGSPAPTMLGQVSTRNKKYSETGWAILMGQYLEGPRSRPIPAVFSFLYLKKNKISKIYVRFGKFQKYTPVALP